MERILLVEPNYKNKYPPIGLMKISTYYKSKGDFVLFHKGLLPAIEVATYNKIFITTLFTFDFQMCVDTIRYYATIVGIDNVLVGGIASSIIPDRFEKAIPGIHILKGQLTSSSVLGYSDDINIDILELDYDMLWDISYEYPASDSYFIYTSRGCPRKCSFCAVKTLEPTFYECENVKEQITRVDQRFGIKKQLLIMDNNALYAPHLSETINTLISIGFGKNNNTIKKCNEIPFLLNSLFERQRIKKTYTHLLKRIEKHFLNIKFSRIAHADAEKLQPFIQLINNGEELLFIESLASNRLYIEDFFERYNHHKIKRYVDFNQGLDARLFTKDKAKLLAQIALKPCRIAFDDIRTEKEYFSAINLAEDSGIQHFSNYLLYNYNDKPEDLWKRLCLNVEYCESHPKIKSLFSFPMKYASIEHIDRSYIGKHWNKKYLKSMNVILNVTAGVVAKEKDFFVRAFGHTSKEFLEILTMPDDFIRYRDYFEDCNLINQWKREFSKLSADQVSRLLNLLSNVDTETTLVDQTTDSDLTPILLFYSIKKNRMEKNKNYYLRLISN